jgi:hypothetical protein
VSDRLGTLSDASAHGATIRRLGERNGSQARYPDGFDGRLVNLSSSQGARARVLVGRGPVEHELTPEFLLWFEHGELEYPIFQSPSIGPPNAALKLSSRPRKIVATADEVVSMIEISLVQA